MEGALELVRSLAPRDAAERMLALQMVAVHAATMRVANWHSRSEQLDQAATHTNALTKLARTYTAQLAGMGKYRSKASQTVRVEHVTVEAGGQAIVGTVETGGRGREHAG